MALTVAAVTVDTTDVARLSTWWADQLGTTVMPGASEWYAGVVTETVALGFQKVEDPTPGKNRLHVDFGADDPAAEVERLLAAGASMVGEHSFDGFSWTTLADPDGNQFCVAAKHEG